MFAIISSFTNQQSENSEQHLLTQIGAITVGQWFVLTSKVTEKDDDLDEDRSNVKR